MSADQTTTFGVGEWVRRVHDGGYSKIIGTSTDPDDFTIRYSWQNFDPVPGCPNGCLHGDGGAGGQSLALFEKLPAVDYPDEGKGRFCFHCNESNAFVPHLMQKPKIRTYERIRYGDILYTPTRIRSIE